MYRSFFLQLTLLFSLSVHADISHNTYTTLLNVIEKNYQADFAARGERLRIDRLWFDDTNQASAWREEDRQGEIAVLRIPGGLARQPVINADAFTLIICHEIGHHLAGPPKVWKYSVEGQADYFGVSSCLRQILPKLPENSVVREETTPEVVVDRCRMAYAFPDEQQLCIRSAMAGSRLTQYFAHKRHISSPEFDRPDSAVLQQTNRGLPNPQCRLDTYFSAALCNPETRRFEGGMPDWLCPTHPLQVEGIRPSCWFNAKN
jgi:hypothetical protein